MDYVDNNERAKDIIAGIEQRLADTIAKTLDGAEERIERALNAAEDVGGERAGAIPNADKDTMDALFGMIWDMLAGLADPGTGLRDLLDAKARDIATVIGANFRIRLKTVEEAEGGDDEGDEPGPFGPDFDACERKLSARHGELVDKEFGGPGRTPVEDAELASVRAQVDVLEFSRAIVFGQFERNLESSTRLSGIARQLCDAADAHIKAIDGGATERLAALTGRASEGTEP